MRPPSTVLLSLEAPTEVSAHRSPGRGGRAKRSQNLVHGAQTKPRRDDKIPREKSCAVSLGLSGLAQLALRGYCGISCSGLQVHSKFNRRICSDAALRHLTDASRPFPRACRLAWSLRRCRLVSHNQPACRNRQAHLPSGASCPTAAPNHHPPRPLPPRPRPPSSPSQPRIMDIARRRTPSYLILTLRASCAGDVATHQYALPALHPKPRKSADAKHTHPYPLPALHSNAEKERERERHAHMHRRGARGGDSMGGRGAHTQQQESTPCPHHAYTKPTPSPHQACTKGGIHPGYYPVTTPITTPVTTLSLPRSLPGYYHVYYPVYYPATIPFTTPLLPRYYPLTCTCDSGESGVACAGCCKRVPSVTACSRSRDEPIVPIPSSIDAAPAFSSSSLAVCHVGGTG